MAHNIRLAILLVKLMKCFHADIEVIFFAVLWVVARANASNNANIVAKLAVNIVQPILLIGSSS